MVRLRDQQVVMRQAGPRPRAANDDSVALLEPPVAGKTHQDVALGREAEGLGFPGDWRGFMPPGPHGFPPF